MENILDKHLNNKIIPELFTTLEADIVCKIKELTSRQLAVIVFKPLYNRLIKVAPELKAINNIFTYKNSIKSIFDNDHPLSKIIPASIMSELQKKENIDYIIKKESSLGKHYIYSFSQDKITTMIDEYAKFGKFDSMEIAFFIMPLFQHLDSNWGKNDLKVTRSFLHKNKINLTMCEILSYYYLVGTKRKHTNSVIGAEYSKQAFSDGCTIISESIHKYLAKDKGLDFLFGVYLDLALMNDIELTKFISNHYTKIPYVRETRQPKAVVIINSNGKDDRKFEFFIKGDGVVVHVKNIYHSKLIQFDLYDTSSSSMVDILGYEFPLDDDCFEGDSLTLLEMVTHDNSNIRVSTNFTFSHSKALKIALNENEEDGLYGYLLDRKGMVHRKKHY